MDHLEKTLQEKYKYGFTSPIEQEIFAQGLSEETIKMISHKKGEPDFLLEWRLKAYHHWKTMALPEWAELQIAPIDFQKMSYFAAPKKKALAKNLDEVDPELRKTFDRLGISLDEQKRMSTIAIDAVVDSASVATTFQKKLKSHGVIFCPMSEAVKKYPNIIKQYLGTVVPYTDNFYAALNSAVFSDGSFCYIPKGVRCPMELSTYFRINASNTGQFERTLIVADAGSYVSYLEGCTAPQRDEHQLHAAVVELIALPGAEIKYSTVQNWYPGDEEGKGGIYNFVTKRGICEHSAKISWTQVETGSAITWKYPSVILKGEHSVGEFYSVAVAKQYQQADTGTKMIHFGKNSKSKIISKGISAGHGKNTYRGLVRMLNSADHCYNFSQCDSLLIGDECAAHTVPYLEQGNAKSTIEHEASTSKINEDMLYYCQQRGLSEEDAIDLIINGYCKEVLDKLPMEFAVEAQNLLSMTLEGTVG